MSLLLLLPNLAHADGLLEQAASLLSSINQNTDESFGMLRAVLGDFVLDPFHTTDGTSGSLLASMFKDFNMFIFAVACLWMAYNMLAGLAQTMHEGVVLGKRMSTVWMPVRVAFGTASLMPVFGGWAFAQAMMVLACLLGIAGADRLVNTAVDSTAAFQVTVNPMGNVKQAGQLHNMELYLVKAAACARGSADMTQAQGSAATFPMGIDTSDSTAIVVKFSGLSPAGTFGQTACGQVKLQFSPRTDTSLRSAAGFRIAGVNYDAIRNVSMQAHIATLQAVYAKAQIIANGASPNASQADLDNTVKELINGYFGLYTATFQSKLAAINSGAQAAANTSAISDQLRDRMKQGGWATLGTWYSTFAEVNEAMNEMLDPVVTYQAGIDDTREASSTYSDVMKGLEGAIEKASGQYQIPQAQSGGVRSATGNWSIGQWIFGGTMDLLAGSSGTGYSNTINPIILFKNLGDNALTAAQTLYFAYKVASGVIGVGGDSSSEPGIMGTLAKKVIGKLPGMNIIASIASDAQALLLPLVFMLFASAATMAFYIPMVPFINWFAALIQWFTSVIESLIGSSLWAMAHFDSDGEGMGQRTSYGYMYLINNFARPIIMTFAFFVGSAAITVLGTFLFRYFGQAVASSQGNSLTGLMSIIAYLVIFCVMGLTLINTTFSMMLHLADRMIGWLGTSHSSAIGQDVENRVSGVFIKAAGGAPSAIQQGMDAKAKGLAASIKAGPREKPMTGSD